PWAVVLILRFLNKRQFAKPYDEKADARKISRLATALLILLGVHTIYSSLDDNVSPPRQSPFISSLLELRTTTSINTLMKADSQAVAMNPVQDCAARPFVFPAISERPWVGVFPDSSDCMYKNYGYGRYGLSST